ncbi:MAG: DUF4145 domain-containing protein [Nanoarchaeota archaeon]
MIDSLKKNIERLVDLLDQSRRELQADAPPPKKGSSPKSKTSAIFDFNKIKQEHRSKLLESQLNNVLAGAMELSKIAHLPENKRGVGEVQSLAMDLDLSDIDGSISSARRMVSLCSRLIDPTPRMTSIKVPHIPEDIREDVLADIRETEKCMSSGCYRSATILCGRILETALHRKYFDVTGQDALEKNPGIGLGNLIAKLVEKNVSFDPGLTQQIHLINQVRVFSVHKKQEAFNPSKAQAEAIVLFTMDALEKLFQKR